MEVHLRGILLELDASKSCTVRTTSPARVAAAAAALQASPVQSLLISGWLNTPLRCVKLFCLEDEGGLLLPPAMGC